MIGPRGISSEVAQHPTQNDVLLDILMQNPNSTTSLLSRL
jgi:hypothetical protein